MATKNVNIDIIAKDKTRQAMQSATKGVDGLKNSVFNLKNALIGIGAGVAIKSFVDVGKQVESLQIRLKFLFNSAEEGAKAFNTMAEFASKVPFSLEQIQQGAGNLAVVSKNADELQKMLEITGRVASVTGLDFRTTAEQIQRSFSAGVASADIFRERGVRDLLGFKAGATVTAEETAEAFEKVFGSNGRFANATSDLANTLEGRLSMIGDKFFNFQKVVAESFFIGLKQEFGALDKALQDNEDVIQKVAMAVGKGLSDAVIFAGNAVRFLSDNLQTIKALGMGFIVFKISTAFLNLAMSIGKARLAMVAFTRLSKTTVVGILLGMGVALAEATNKLDDFFAIFEKPKGLQDFKEEFEILISQLELFEFQSDKGFNSVARNVEKLVEEMIKAQEAFDLGTKEFSEFERMIQKIANAISAIPIEEDLRLPIQRLKDDTDAITKSFEAFGFGFSQAMEKQKDVFKQFEEAGKRAFTNFSNVLADTLLTGKFAFNDFARSVLQDIARIISRQLTMLAIQKALGFFGVGSIFGVSVGKIFGFAEGGRPPVGQPSIVGEKGAELFVPDQAGTIVPNDKLGMGKNVTVNFNINTVDARGFNELLVNSRGTIVNLINSAMNEKGKMAIV